MKKPSCHAMHIHPPIHLAPTPKTSSSIQAGVDDSETFPVSPPRSIEQAHHSNLLSEAIPICEGFVGRRQSGNEKSY